MKKILLFFILFSSVFFLKAQTIDKATAINLVEKNIEAIGLSKDLLKDVIVSSAYYDLTNDIKRVYLLQSYKGLPVYNQMLVLAFKNEKLISHTGGFINNMEKLTNTASAQPIVSPEAAIGSAFKAVNVKIPSAIAVVKYIESGKKLDFGLLKGVTENVLTDLMWVPVENQKDTVIKLAWQVKVVPANSDDYWNLRVDAVSKNIISKNNLTVYEDFNPHTLKGSYNNSPNLVQNLQAKLTNNNSTGSPSVVVSANYLVIPYPYEAPSFTTAANRTDPWTAAAGNASTLGWHSTGSVDYTISRGNNVWATEDTIATNLNSGLPATSSTAPNPLTFNNPPNYTVEPSRNTAMQQFCITNLFYWNNIVHDVAYQYGFNELAGNFQVNNLGRGGAGNDDVSALAQSGGSGTHIGNNANFSTPADGGRGRMRMYLFDAIPTISLVVNTPGSIAGSYPAVESGFSTANKISDVGPVSGQVVYFDDVAGSAHEACGSAANPLTGKIALINRGSCNFTLKVLTAQNAGAIGVIMVNNVATAPIIMGGTDNTITIPAVMISQANGAIFAAQLANNLTVTLSGTAGVVLDGDLDNGIISHEYGHGISNRFTGGPANAGCLSNIEQGGEGWSDYFGLMMTTNWASTGINDGGLARPIGTYVVGQTPTGSGIRNFPYSTNMTTNPLTYANMGVGNIGTEVHNIGEIWCAAIWDMTWGIIQQEGSINANLYNASSAGGNSIALKLVFEGMKLQPCSPGFLDARDAILTADSNLYGGRHFCTIWSAFARRGMGFSAVQGSSNSATDQTAAFDLPLSPVITTQPVNASVCAGANATFTVIASGTNLSFNWQVSTDGGTTWTNVSPAATTATLTITAVTTGMNNNKYRVIVSGGCTAPTTVTSNAATLTLNTTGPAITTQPINSSVCSGSNATFTVVATGPNLSYNWQVSTDGGTTWGNLSPAVTTPTLTLTAVTVAMNNNQYRAVVTGGCTGTVIINSNAAVLSVTAGTVTITSQPANTTACSGNTATFTVAASGPSVTYAWQVSTDGGTTWVNVTPAATSSTLTLTSVTAAMNNNQYRVVVTGTGGCSTAGINSSTATLTVNASTTITTQPANAVICIGSNTSFCVVATGFNITYQWQLNTSGCSGAGTWTDIPGATSSCFNINGATIAMNNFGYRCKVNGACGLLTSNCASLNVNAAATITSQPANTTVCSGTNATFTVGASGFGLTYQWQVSSNGGTTWTDISEQTNASLTLINVTVAMNNNQYRAVVFSCGPVGTNSNAAILSVTPPVNILSQPTGVSLCAGNNASFSVSASGVGAVTYQWQVSTNGGTTWTNITGATTSTLNLSAVTAAMNGNQYRVVLNGTCTVNLNSDAATLNINTPVTITTQPANTSACIGSTATLFINATGTSITYQWQVSINGGAFTNINNGSFYTGVSTNTLVISNVNTSLNGNAYKVIASGVPCGAVTSNTAVLTINPLPIVVLNSSSITSINPGTRAELTATANPAGTYSYQWYRNGVLVPSVTSAGFPLSVDGFGSYEVVATDAKGCKSSRSNAISITDSVSSQLFVYPSPSTGVFQVRYFNAGNPVPVTSRTLNIFDSKGAQVFAKSFPITGRYDKMEVNLKNAQHGVYLIELRDVQGKRIATGKVIIE